MGRESITKRGFDLERALAEYRAGYSFKEIANHQGFSEGPVYNLLRPLVQVRDRGWDGLGKEKREELERAGQRFTVQEPAKGPVNQPKNRHRNTGGKSDGFRLDPAAKDSVDVVHSSPSGMSRRIVGDIYRK